MTLASPFPVDFGVVGNPEIAGGTAFERPATAGHPTRVSATPVSATPVSATPVSATPVSATPVPVGPDAGEATRTSAIPESIGIPESSGRLGRFELLVVVSEMSRQTVAPPLLREVSLDDVSSHRRYL